MKIEVINKPLKYSGKVYSVGDVLDVGSRNARILLALERAVLYIERKPKKESFRQPVVRRVIAPKVVSDAQRTENETTEKEPVVTDTQKEEEQEISPRTGLPKRRYRRRDMEATE